MFGDQMFTTPEGFELSKPLLFPEVRRFEELFEIDGLWDFATMNHRNGVAPDGRPVEITDNTRPGGRRPVGRFCSTRQLEGRAHMVVTAKPQLLDACWGDRFAFFDRIGFQAIGHHDRDRVLIVASASAILASAWVAYVATDSVPTTAELAAAVQA